MEESPKPMRRPLAGSRRCRLAPVSSAALLERAVLALMFLLAWRGAALAYIDQNAGGFLAQVLAPLAAILLSLLYYCRREVRRFAKALRTRLRRGASPAQPDARESGK